MDIEILYSKSKPFTLSSKNLIKTKTHLKIGLLSDTHGYLDPLVFKYFDEVDEIWHAGDIGSLELLKELENFKPTKSVFGNIDGHEIRAASPENLILNIQGVKVLITHIAGKPPFYNSRVKALIKANKPNILICGHSHILKVEYDKSNQLLFMNPGVAGKHGFHRIKTLLRFEINDGKAQNLEVIEMGPRAKSKT